MKGRIRLLAAALAGMCFVLPAAQAEVENDLEVTMKVLPVAEETRTLLIAGLTDEIAVEAMCAAMGSPRPPHESLTNYMWAWGQFLDHEIDLTPSNPDEKLR